MMSGIKDLDFKLSVLTASLRDCSARLYKLSTESEKLAKRAKNEDLGNTGELILLCDKVIAQCHALNTVPSKICTFIKDCLEDGENAA